MKTMLILPDALARRLKLRAVRDRRKVNDVAADILRAALAPRAKRRTEKPAVIVKDKRTGLPVIQCRRAAPKGRELTPDLAAEILASQEAGWVRDSG
jgi:plasmid stability protein